MENIGLAQATLVACYGDVGENKNKKKEVSDRKIVIIFKTQLPVISNIVVAKTEGNTLFIAISTLLSHRTLKLLPSSKPILARIFSRLQSFLK